MSFGSENSLRKLRKFAAIPLNRFFFFFLNDTSTTEIYTLSLTRRSSDLIAGGLPALRRVHDSTLTLGCCHATRRSEEHTSELQSHVNLVCRLLLEKKNLAPFT